MLMPERNGGGNYRYGYQGSEKDNEVKGEGNSYTTHFRQLDPRLGRWLTIDPKASSLPWQSPYCSMDNNPILLNDVLGDCPQCFVGAIAGALTEFTIQVFDNMFFENMNFETSIANVDKSDVAVEAAYGFASGFFTGGVDKITKLFKGKYRKVAGRILSEISESTVDILGDVSKKTLNGEQIDVITVLEDAGMNKISSKIIPSGGGQFNRDFNKFNKQINKAASAKRKMMKYQSQLKLTKSKKIKNQLNKKIKSQDKKFNKSSDKAIKIAQSSLAEAIGETIETVDAGLMKNIANKAMRKITNLAKEKVTSIEIGNLKILH